MERFNEMKEYILPKWNERFAADQSKIQMYFNGHQKELVLKFRNYIINHLISKVKDDPSEEGQGESAFLIISYLHSSLLTRSYEYEINFCNEMLYVDKDMITCYWCPEFLYQYAADEELFLQKELQRKFTRLKKYEIEMLRKDLFTQYWNIGRVYFKKLIDRMRESGEFNKIWTDGELQILYGEHMGELKELI